MCKHCVCGPVVQVLVGQLIVSGEEDSVGVHQPGRSSPAHREVGGASCDCDISGRSRFCGNTSHQMLRKFHCPPRRFDPEL